MKRSPDLIGSNPAWHSNSWQAKFSQRTQLLPIKAEVQGLPPLRIAISALEAA